MPRDDSVYLHHILDAISKAETYLEGVDRQTFSVRRLSRDLRDQYPKIPWQDIAGMRDKLIHDYFGVDLETVWLTALDDLPVLKTQVSRILSESESSLEP